MTQSEQNFLAATLEEVSKALKEEERKVKLIATEMYRTWQELQKCRESLGFKDEKLNVGNTGIQLKVYQTQTLMGETEYVYDLVE